MDLPGYGEAFIELREREIEEKKVFYGNPSKFLQCHGGNKKRRSAQQVCAGNYDVRKKTPQCLFLQLRLFALVCTIHCTVAVFPFPIIVPLTVHCVTLGYLRDLLGFFSFFLLRLIYVEDVVQQRSDNRSFLRLRSQRMSWLL